MPEKNKKPGQSALRNEAGEEKKLCELEEFKKKCEEYLNGWKRERADFINYKKEEMERISQIIKYANEELILKLLPILDNFCLAEQHIKDLSASASPQAMQAGEGVTQIKKQLEDFLAKEGIEPIKTIGEKFDPAIMEAVDGEGDTVAEETQTGYTLHGKLIRPAKVKLSK